MPAGQDAINYRHIARNSLAQAFAISLGLHFVIISGMEVGRTMGLWKRSALPKWMQQTIDEQLSKGEKKEQEEKLVQLPVMEQEIEIPLMFVEVDPAEAVREIPKKAKYYSSANSLASNPDISKNEEQPKISGTQDKVPKAFEVMRPAPQPLAPAPESQNDAKAPPLQPQPSVEEEEPEPTRKGEEPEGDILLAKAPKPLTNENKDPGKLLARSVPPQPKPEVPKRPRTLAEVMPKKGLIEGQKMKQEGGVQRHSIGSNLSAIATPFGVYDAAFIAAVDARWKNILQDRDFVQSHSGRVVLQFRLNVDGRITAMHVLENEVSETLAWICQRAVLDPSPYQALPTDLRRLLKADYRDVKFTFYYNQ